MDQTRRMIDNIVVEVADCGERGKCRSANGILSYNYIFMAGCTVCGSNPGQARFIAPVQICPGFKLPSCDLGNVSLSLGQSCRGVALTTHLHLVPRLKKG